MGICCRRDEVVIGPRPRIAHPTPPSKNRTMSFDLVQWSQSTWLIILQLRRVTRVCDRNTSEEHHHTAPICMMILLAEYAPNTCTNCARCENDYDFAEVLGSGPLTQGSSEHSFTVMSLM